MLRYYYSFIFLICFLGAKSQSMYDDQVYLKNGSVLRCKIVDYKTEGQIKLEIQGGSILVYDSFELLKVERGTKKQELSETKIGHFYNKEAYFSILFNFIGGYRESSSWVGSQDIPTLGCGLKFSAGKSINRHLMLGAGVAWAYMHNYFMYSAHYPIFIEARGDILKKSNSLYYSFGIGYNIARRRNSMSWIGTTMVDAKGGIYANPAIGIRFASKSKKHFCLELNYAIHTASYSYNGTNGEIIGPTNNVFIRPALALGILF